MKKLIVGIISMTLLMSVVVFADDVVELFNLITLGETAVENSLTIDSKALTLDNKILDLEEVEKDAFNADQMGGDRVTFISNRIKVESDTIVAKMEVWKAEQALEKSALDLENDIYKKGMNYLLLEDEITLNEVKLANLEVYVSNVEKKVTSGIATSTDLVNKKIELSSQEMKLIELMASLEAAKIELNHLVGHDLDTELNLEDDIVLMLFTAFDAKKFYTERQATYPDIYEKTVLLEARTIEFDLYASKYLVTNKEYKTALYNKQIAEINLSDAKQSFDVALRTANNKYLNAYDAYTLTEKQLELQSKLVEDADLKYSLGLINTEDLLKAQEAKLTSEFAVTQAKVLFNTSRIDYLNLK